MTFWAGIAYSWSGHPGRISFAIVQASGVWVGLVRFQCNELSGRQNAVEIIFLLTQIIIKISNVGILLAGTISCILTDYLYLKYVVFGVIKV